MVKYTNKNLADVLDLNMKSLKDCGIMKDDMRQVACNAQVHSFIIPSNIDLFEQSVVGSFEELTEEQSQIKIKELEEIQKQEIDEAYKKTDTYKIKKLEEENANINYILMQNNLV